RGGTLYTVPAAQTGILAGTTARWLLERAASLGWSHGAEMIRPGELAECDGAWLTSSVRGVAAIPFRDGAPRRTPLEGAASGRQSWVVARRGDDPPRRAGGVRRCVAHIVGAGRSGHTIP